MHMLYMLLYIRVFDFLLTPWPQLFWYSRTRSKPWKNAKLHKMYGVLTITPNDPKFLTPTLCPIFGAQYLRDYPSNQSKNWYTYSPRQGLSNKSKIAWIQSLESELLSSKVRAKNKLPNQFRPIRSSNITAPLITWQREESSPNHMTL